MSDPTDAPVDVVATAATEQRAAPTDAIQAADLADKYAQMLRLADLFDDAGAQMREWAQLGRDILTDPDVTESSAMSSRTWTHAEEELRAATTGRNGLLSRSIELDADALVLRATVMTYRWIDELQEAAYQTLGNIAGRAIGYLAPQINLGGAIVAAGLIETDALDRDGVAAYLNDLAESNPDLMDHVTTGGGLLDSLQMRGLLTAGVLSGDAGRAARAGGLRAAGVVPLGDDWGSALRDVAVDMPAAAPRTAHADAASVHEADHLPSGLGDLMDLLEEGTGNQPVRILRAAPGRLLVFVAGRPTASTTPGHLRLVSGDPSAHAAAVIRALSAAIEAADTPDEVHVMLVGHGGGGAAAIEVATHTDLPGFVVDQVVTANAPAVQLPVLPEHVEVLSLEDRSDPVALLGSLINAAATNRLTVVYDASEDPDVATFVAGGRAADRADHPQLVAALDRWRNWGYLTSASIRGRTP